MPKEHNLTTKCFIGNELSLFELKHFGIENN